MKEYIFANWGEKVWIKNPQGYFMKGKITELDANSNEFNVKVVCDDGLVMWRNRDEIELDMQYREIFLSNLKNHSYAV